MKFRELGFLVLFCIPAICGAQVLVLKENKETPEEAKPVNTEVSRPDQTVGLLYARWGEFENAYRAGRWKEEDSLLSQMVSLRVASQFPRFTELSIAAIQFGKAELSQKHIDEALKLFRVAAELDSSFPSAYYSQAQAHLARGIVGLIPAIRLAIQGALSPLGSFSGKIYFTLKYSLLFSFVLLLIGFVFAVAMLVKYFRLFLHDVQEFDSQRRNPDLLRLLTIIFLFLPVLLLFGPLWLAPFWLAVLWGYSRISERIVTGFFFLVFIFAYPVYRGVVNISSVLTQPNIYHYVDLFSEGPAAKMISDYEQYVSDHPEDSDATLMLAYLYKTDQKLKPAIETLQRQIERHPADARAYNNLAIVYYSQGELETALTMAEKASSLDPSNATYPYNLSHLNRAKFNFQDAERMLSRARSIDPEMVRRLETGSNMKLKDALPSEEFIWQKIKQAWKKSGFLSNPFSLFSVILFFFMLFLHYGKKKKRGFSRECIKCGKPFCKKCQPSEKEARFCTQCMHIFIRKDGVSPVSRKEKMSEIEKYSRSQELFSRLSSLVLPGFGSLLRNQVVSGTLFLAIWIALLAIVMFNRTVADLSYMEPSENVSVLTLACVCFMTLTYILANVSLLRKTKSANSV